MQSTFTQRLRTHGLNYFQKMKPLSNMCGAVADFLQSVLAAAGLEQGCSIAPAGTQSPPKQQAGAHCADVRTGLWPARATAG